MSFHSLPHVPAKKSIKKPQATVTTSSEFTENANCRAIQEKGVGRRRKEASQVFP